MDTTRIAAIYLELEQSAVKLPPDPQGPGILKLKLQECRTRQDAIILISMEVLKATSKVKQGIRAAKAALPLLPKGTPNFLAMQDELRVLEDTLDDLRALEQSVRVVRNNLKTTDSDIRLHAQLTDQQIRLGEIQPPPQPPPTPAPPSEHATTVPAAAIAQTFDPAAAAASTTAAPAATPDPPWLPVDPAVTAPPATGPSAPSLQQPVTTVDVVDINTFLGVSQ